MSETAQLELDLAEALAQNRAELHGQPVETSLSAPAPTPVAAPTSPVASDVKAPDSGHANPAPPQDTHPDLSWAPEDCRAEFAKLSPSVLAKTKSAWHAGTDYTRKTQDLADARSKFREEQMDTQDDARLGYKVRNIPELNKLVAEWIEGQGRETKPSIEDDVPDLFNMAPDEAREALRVWQKRVIAQAADAGLSRVQDTYIRPMERDTSASSFFCLFSRKFSNSGLKSK